MGRTLENHPNCRRLHMCLCDRWGVTMSQYSDRCPVGQHRSGTVCRYAGSSRPEPSYPSPPSGSSGLASGGARADATVSVSACRSISGSRRPRRPGGVHSGCGLGWQPRRHQHRDNSVRRLAYVASPRFGSLADAHLHRMEWNQGRALCQSLLRSATVRHP